MARRARRTAPVRDDAASDLPVVGLREPCPCGSGRRYKACHGRSVDRGLPAFVARPFAGLPGEADWVALRELVPAGTAPLRLLGQHAGRDVLLATVLPLTWAALHREDGQVLVGLQAPAASGDPGRDVAAALLEALAAPAGTPVPTAGARGDAAPRLQDLLDLDAPLDVQVHDGFDFWLGAAGAGDPEIAASMERANAAVVPTVRLSSVPAAYWCALRGRNSLRWVLPEDEEPLLDALARLRVARADSVVEGSRFLGTYRACGLLAPVWDLRPEVPAEALEEPAARYAQRLGDALAVSAPLTSVEREARAGLLSRQLTLR